MPLAYGLTEPVDLALASLPQALDRLRIAHLTDLHLVKHSKRLDRLIYQLTKFRLDLGLLTGDYMLHFHPLEPAVRYLRELTSAVKPALGWYGVFGNHDAPDLIDAVADLPITWLCDEAVALDELPIEIIGTRCTLHERHPDTLALAAAVDALPTGHEGRGQRLRLMLSHIPDMLPLASDLDADLMLSGHTHGGQIRLPFNTPLFNSSDLPLHLTSGLLRHRDTLAIVSRGLGATDLLTTPIRARLFCPPHAPIYTLRRNTTPGEATAEIQAVWRW